MNYDETRKTIETYFKTQWSASVFVSVPIRYENTEGSLPYDTIPLVTLSIRDASGSIASLGSLNGLVQRYTGVILFQIFTEVNTGTSEAKKIADTIGNIFKAREIVTNNNVAIYFKLPSTDNINRTSSTFQLNMSIEFEYDLT